MVALNARPTTKHSRGKAGAQARRGKVQSARGPRVRRAKAVAEYYAAQQAAIDRIGALRAKRLARDKKNRKAT
jgi:hypothetical protein